MASYFEEHDCEPGSGPPEELHRQALLELARSLFSGLEIDVDALGGGDWDHRLPPPASRQAVESLPMVQVTPVQADKGLKCPVCLLEFEEDETVRKMPCQHLFHAGCILPWLGKVRTEDQRCPLAPWTRRSASAVGPNAETNSCPLCRHELPTDDEQYEEYKKDKVRRQQQAHRLEGLHGAMYT
ncbi:E3 ubiquitin-protein ligase RNF181 isoform X1 [Pogona vitticeps]